MHIKDFLYRLETAKHPASRIAKTSCITIVTELYKNDDKNTLKIERKSTKEALENFARFYPLSERWRLFVDGKKYAKRPPRYYFPVVENKYTKTAEGYFKLNPSDVQASLTPLSVGWCSYEEKEPGCLTACLNAFNYALGYATHSRNDVQFIKSICEILLTNVTFKNRDVIKGSLFRNGTPGYFGMVHKQRRTPEGVLDLINEVEVNLEGAAIACNLASADAILDLDEFEDLIFDVLYNEGADFELEEPLVLTGPRLKRIKTDYPALADEFLHEFAKICAKSGYRYYTIGSYHCKYIDTLYKPYLSLGVDDNETLPLDTTGTPQNRFIKELITKFPITLTKELNLRIHQCLFLTDPPMALDETIFDSLKTQIEKSCSDPKYFESLKNIFPEITSQSSSVDKLTIYCIHVLVGEQVNQRIEKLVAETLREYYYQLKKCENDDEILLVIGKTIQQFERIHPFLDFNGRTFVNVLLNILLLENGFPPATFYEPSLFDAYGDLLNVIKRGIANTLEIYESVELGKPVDLFGVTTVEIESDLHKKIAEIEHDNSLSDECKLLYLQKKKNLLMETILSKMNSQEIDVEKYNPSGTRKTSFGL